MNYLNSIASGITTADSGLQLNNIEVLYTKVQRIYIKPQHKEERQRDLRVNVEIHAGISPVCRKVISEQSSFTSFPILTYRIDNLHYQTYALSSIDSFYEIC